jgi:precorrin-6B methylase 1
MNYYKKHWSAFLPDAGRPIIAKGEYIIGIEMQITRLKKEIDNLQKKSNEKEQELLSEIKNEWSTTDIIKARELALSKSNINA